LKEKATQYLYRHDKKITLISEQQNANNSKGVGKRFNNETSSAMGEQLMKNTLSCSLSDLTSIRLLFLCVLDTVGVAGIVSGSSFTGCPAFAVNVICNK